MNNKRFINILVITMLTMLSCATKKPIQWVYPNPEIIFLGDPINDDRKNLIIDSTEEFCQNADHGHVIRIKIDHNKKTDITRVKYKCEKSE